MPDKHDLHEPDRHLKDLSEYEHLHRVYRLCDAHIKRNIRKRKVSEAVRNKMRSLVCMEHPHFESTVQEIAEEGGNEGSSTLSYSWHRDFS